MRPPGAASPSAKSIPEDEILLTIMAGRMKMFGENTSTIPQILSFRDFYFGGRGETGSPFWCVLVCLGQSLACVKKFRAQHPLRAEI